VYTYMYMLMYIDKCIYLYIYLCMYTYICVYIYINIHVKVIHIFTCICIHIKVRAMVDLATYALEAYRSITLFSVQTSSVTSSDVKLRAVVRASVCTVLPVLMGLMRCPLISEEAFSCVLGQCASIEGMKMYLYLSIYICIPIYVYYTCIFVHMYKCVNLKSCIIYTYVYTHLLHFINMHIYR
jgi:hypothetical protein